MPDAEVLVLNGSPGSGKSTVAEAIAETLREANQTHVVIDVDELGRVYPETYGGMGWDNLAAVWQNYSQIAGIKVILPVCIDDQEVLSKLKRAIEHPGRLTICELVAPLDTLRSRVAEREPNDYWRQKLKHLVDNYANRPHKFGDFQVSTANLTPQEVAVKVIERLGWSEPNLRKTKN